MTRLTIDRAASNLLIVDFQARLMPVIDSASSVLANAQRLIDAAAILGIPVHVTEQNAEGLGPTVSELETRGAPVIHKMTFDATRAPGFSPLLEGAGAASAFIVAGCEAHVCVAQTVLGLIGRGARVYLVEDALGSRRPANRRAAIERLRSHGAEIVTTEMVVFEWLDTAEDPRTRELIALIK